MGGLDHVKVEIIVSQDGAADGGHTNGFFSETQLVQALGHKSVGDGMAATGTIVGRGVL
jgi:hypothetical protein